MEALSFQHYIETQSVISYDEAQSKLSAMCGEAGKVSLSPEDYLLGICDMTGELMRFSITFMATNGELPAGDGMTIISSTEYNELDSKMDLDNPDFGLLQHKPKPRTVLDDLRAIRLQLEMFEARSGSKLALDLSKNKMPVMRECVDKVEKALYGLTVRGSERPKGWMPDMGGERRAEVEGY